MKSIFSKALLMTGIVGLMLSSCVPARQFEEVKAQQQECEKARKDLLAEKQDLETRYNELNADHEVLDRKVGTLEADTTILGKSLRKMTVQYDKINRLNDELLKKQSELRGESERENRKLLMELQALQLDLQKREDDLLRAQRELEKKQSDLQILETKLERREQRVKELERIISQQDSAANALKDKIAQALLGFKDKGLKVEERNGKIYVSLDAKLLFPKGSTNIDPEGKKALLELAGAVKDQKDLQITVEGHTDSDPIRGGAMKDNWDLSVQRATAVVRILVDQGKLDPNLLSAAGRGEHVPVDPGDTEEAKAKNRRIEIILTPDLDELFDIIEE